jgi:CheY-like chemotaxis protein
VPDAVLVVEDDPDLREMMEQLLHLEGFAPLTAPNGREALTLLQAGAPVKAILLDLMMPVMDGWEFRERQLSTPELAGIPVVVISAVDVDRMDRLNPAAAFRKPLAFDQVIEFLQRLCQGIPRRV